MPRPRRQRPRRAAAAGTPAGAAGIWGYWAALRHARREHHHGGAGPVEALLDGERGLVVEQALVPALAFEDHLATEEGDHRKLLHDPQAQPLGLLDRVGADRRSD